MNLLTIFTSFFLCACFINTASAVKECYKCVGSAACKALDKKPKKGAVMVCEKDLFANEWTDRKPAAPPAGGAATEPTTVKAARGGRVKKLRTTTTEEPDDFDDFSPSTIGVKKLTNKTQVSSTPKGKPINGTTAKSPAAGNKTSLPTKKAAAAKPPAPGGLLAGLLLPSTTKVTSVTTILGLLAGAAKPSSDVPDEVLEFAGAIDMDTLTEFKDPKLLTGCFKITFTPKASNNASEIRGCGPKTIKSEKLCDFLRKGYDKSNVGKVGSCTFCDNKDKCNGASSYVYFKATVIYSILASAVLGTLF